MRIISSVFGVFAVVLVFAGCHGGNGDAPSAGPLVVRDSWVRSADSGVTGGAYLTLANVDTIAVTVVALSTPVAKAAELHETMQMEGMVHMAARPNLVVARDSTLSMKPGGLHVMLSELNRALRVGDTVALTLTLADGRSIPVAMPVRAP